MFRGSILSGFFILAVLSANLFAQEAQSESDRSRQLLRNQMDLKLNELEAATGAQEDNDLGAQILVRRKPKPWSLTLSSDTTEIWSNNVFLESEFPKSDFATAQNSSMTVSYQLIENLTLIGSLRHSMFRYNRLIAQDFDAYNAGGSLNYKLPWDISLTTGLQWTMIYSIPAKDFVYEEYDASGGIMKLTKVEFAPWMKDHIFWMVGAQMDYRRTSPEDFEKIEYTPYTGLTFLIPYNIMAQVSYRWQYQDFQQYQQTDRYDILNTGSGSLSWSPLKWLTLSASCSYTHNNSVEAPRDYEALTAGANLRLSWTF
jgi:hypothetical protein